MFKFLKFLETKNDVKNERGFYILEVLIDFAIVGVVSLGVMQFAQNSGTLARKVNQENEIFKMLDTLKSVLDNEEVCDNTFKGLNPHGQGDNVGVIRYKNSSNKLETIKVGGTYGEGSSKFVISKMKIKDYNTGKANLK
jgi:hypothetical protein